MTTKDRAPPRTEHRRGFRFRLRTAAAIIGLVASGSATPGYAASTPSIRTAVVGANGKLVRGKGAVSSRLVLGPPGFYEVTFSTSVAKCAYFVGLGDSTIFSQPEPASASSAISPFNTKTVVVGTFLNPDIRANLPFNLLVVC